MKQLRRLVDFGSTVVLVGHDIQVIAESDWVIDMGPGAGEGGRRVTVTGTPEEVAKRELARPQLIYRDISLDEYP